MRRKIRVLYVSAECGPYGKTGGLGEVAYSLPQALEEEDIDICRVIPLYRTNCEKLKYRTDFSVAMGKGYRTCIIKQLLDNKSVPTYFIANDWYFNRDNIYGYHDDGERFMFFCKAVMEMIKNISLKPDIIHCNDWHTGFIPFFTRFGSFDTRTVFTIHNIKYSGWAPYDYIEEYNAEDEVLKDLGYPKNLNFIKTGLIHSDFITTVSPGYAGEILTHEMGGGMDNVLKGRKETLKGILNGIDTKTYNPSRTGDVVIPYSVENSEKKRSNKSILKKELGLSQGDVPLVCAVTRLDEQKGIDIIIEGISKMRMKGLQFVLMGTGSIYYQKMLHELQERYKGKICIIFDYDPSLARRIYAGSDIYVMPSRYEPCGLGQQYAMAYGTVPVVRRTGGLKDTVIDMDEGIDKANGFCFNEYTASAFVDALRRAVKSYKTPEWVYLMRNAMNVDRSWNKSAKEYIEIYKKLLKR